jgi:hypothetical protein
MERIAVQRERIKRENRAISNDCEHRGRGHFLISAMIQITPDHNVETYSGVIQVNVEPIPESFFRGLADCEAGRTIDMGRATNEPSPGNA